MRRWRQTEIGCMSYTNKVAYITGGSSGIGLALARGLVKGGAHLVLLARNADMLEAAARSLEADRVSTAQSINICPVDVTDREALSREVTSAATRYGKPDILIACAGVALAKCICDVSADEFNRVMDINFTGTFNSVYATLPHIEERGGKILIVSSMAGLMGVYGYSAYCASKHAQVGFAEALHYELAEKNIQVSLLCPPEVDTPLLLTEKDTMPAKTRLMKDMAGTLPDKLVADYTLKRFAKNGFMIIPGFRARLSDRLSRWMPNVMRGVVASLLSRVSLITTGGRG